jgi:hypothetical protein
MLPAPFYAEVPADLGDDQTWGDEAAGGHAGDEPRHRSSRSLRALVDDMITARVLTLASRVSRKLAP